MHSNKKCKLNMLHVMVNGMPGPMATETARVCIDRGFTLVNIGFTGPDNAQDGFNVDGANNNNVQVDLIKGPGIDNDAINKLKSLKEQYPDLIVVDYTHPSAVLNNIEAYVNTNCDFVMGTTGGDAHKMNDILDKGTNSAVIAPNMAKQIVALQAGIEAMVKRFPGSYKGYKLLVTESHQSSKADTSGTAKAVVHHLATLNGENFKIEDIEMLRSKEKQMDFGVPVDALKGHAWHTYRMESPDGSVAFELKHNVCGRRVYAEGTADAVQFLDKVRGRGTKRVYNMIDVLESGQMS